MRVFKTVHFAKFAKKQNIDDQQLFEAIQRAEQGLIDADLGGKIIKQRVARKGQGKSKGYRTLIIYKVKNNHFFISGFAKNEQENIAPDLLESLKELVKHYESYTDEGLNFLCIHNKLIEITQENNDDI